MKPTRALAALALVVGLGHLPFVASSLEDIDSVNFALGLRDFDVADHRPHPPGYPVYVAAGKVVAAATRALGSEPGAVEARALSLLSLAAAVAAVFLLFRVFAAPQSPRGDTPPWASLDVPALATTALAVTCPLFWILAVRPLSDLPGLAAALAAQACLLSAWWHQTPSADGDRRLPPDRMARSGQLIVLGALLAGLAVGVRTQTLWLTAPLLAVVLADRIGRGVAGAIVGGAMTFTIGALAWFVPLVMASGGPGAYLAALGAQAGQDVAGGEMLYLNPAPRLIAIALMHTFVDPWDSVPLAAVVLTLAAVGSVGLLMHDRRALVAVAGMSVPYLAFHLLFQDTSFPRYALPFVPVVSFLAVNGVRLISARAVAPVIGAVSLWAVALASPTLMAYAAEAPPAVRVLAAVNAEARSAPPAALALHQTFERPLEAEQVAVERVLRSPPRREWLELAEFWKRVPAGTVWFLADPRRTDLALIDPRSRRDVTEIRWSPAERPVFGDMRPAAVDWIRMPRPRWFAEEGWALTPETAGMARLMGRGPHLGPIVARVTRDLGPARVMMGGRHLGGPDDPAVRFTMAVDDRVVETWDAPPGFFLRVVDLPDGALAGDGSWAALSVQSVPLGGEAPVPTAIEQFDVQDPGTLMWAFDTGWHEAEFSPALGVWHWTSDQAAIRVLGASSAVRVTLEIEAPSRYFSSASQVTATAGGVDVARATLGASESWTFEVPLEALDAGGGTIVIGTSQTFVPGDRDQGPDRRRLGLRVMKLRVIPVGLR